RGRAIQVPVDISSAAFFLVAAALVPGSAVTIPGVGVNPTRTGLLDVLGEMGAGLRGAGARGGGGAEADGPAEGGEEPAPGNPRRRGPDSPPHRRAAGSCRGRDGG